MSALQTVRDALLRRGSKLAASGDGFSACCPGHEDRRASLSISEGRDGRVLLRCHAGCELRDIVAALGLELSDLFAGEEHEPARRLVATYRYQDESGTLLYEVLRYEPKDFRQRAASGKWSLVGVPRVPYGLPSLREAIGTGRLILYVEGEKDVETARSLGFTATTHAGGAAGWRPEYAAFLTGADIVLIPDNDGAGREMAEKIAAAIGPVARRVRVVRLPGVPVHGDLTDWHQAGGTKEELTALIENSAGGNEQDGKTSGTGNEKRGGFHLEPVSALLESPDEKVPFVVEGMLPHGGFSLIAAKPKVGKSTLSRQLARDVARGEQFLGRETSKGPVVMLSLEEKRSEVRRHLQDLGVTREDPIKIHFGAAPGDALDALRRLVDETHPVLVIVDTLFRFANVKDANDYAQVIKVTTPLVDLARETGAHVCAVHHMGKGEREGADGILGSTAIFGSVDTAVILRRLDGYRTISTIQRYGDDLPETVVCFNKASRSFALGGTKAEANEARVGAAILAALAGHRAAVGEEVLLADVEGKTGLKRTALRELVKSRSVARYGEGRKGKPFLYALPGTPEVAIEEPDLQAEVDSRFLVPPTHRERGNEKPECGPGPLRQRLHSRSVEVRVPETRSETPAALGDGDTRVLTTDEKTASFESTPVGRRVAL